MRHIQLHVCLTLLAVGLLASVAGTELWAEETAQQEFVISVERIWDRAEHCAFTDLIEHDGSLYCAFREGSGHIPGLNGVVRVIRSEDGVVWESVARFDEPHFDLRDPKLSKSPDGRLVVNMGASRYHGRKRLGIESRVAFSTSGGDRFEPLRPVVFPAEMTTGGDWLWRVTWHDGAAWGCVQQLDNAGAGRALQLVKSTDGVHYQLVKKLDVENPTETTLRFLPDQTMVAMIRRTGKQPPGWLGFAKPPYTQWNYLHTDRPFGGPNLIQLPCGAWLAGSRDYSEKPYRTALWWCDLKSGKFTDLVQLPSDGDNSYPGLVVDEARKRLYVSYYSSHQGSTAIYLATLRLDALQQAAPTATD